MGINRKTSNSEEAIRNWNLAQLRMSGNWSPTKGESVGDQFSKWTPYFTRITAVLRDHGMNVSEFEAAFPGFQERIAPDLEQLRREMEELESRPLDVTEVSDCVRFHVEALKDAFGRLMSFLLSVTIPLRDGPRHHAQPFALESGSYPLTLQEGEMMPVVIGDGPCNTNPALIVSSRKTAVTTTTLSI